MIRARAPFAFATVMLALGCAHATGPTTSGPPAAPPLAITRETLPKSPAHALVVEAASCWFGGLWGDVQGESPAERKADAERRCASVVRDVYGADDRTRYERLRAFEPITIHDVAAKVAALADASSAEAPRKQALVTLLGAVADAQRETMLARRAGHRILRDAQRGGDALTSAEAAALPELEAAHSFDALAQINIGDLQREAHAFTLLVALDRMDVAQEIPLHLKAYPVVEPFRVVFGVPIPALPHDASKPLPRGGWLAYLTSVASAAGHPVMQSNAPPQIRHEQAVGGILGGLADQLKRDAGAVEPPFAQIVQFVIRDLDAVAKANSA